MEFVCGPEWDKRIVDIEPADKVGILVSSGVDSTTLLFLLHLYFESEIRIFNVQTSEDPKKPVIEKILRDFNLDYEIEVVGKDRYNWPMKAHYPRLCLAFQEIRDTTGVQELYCGNILTPHPQFFPRWDVSQSGIPKRPWLTNDSFLKNPLEHVEKYHVVDLGRSHGFSEVYKTTISCNVLAEDHCGQCMGCREIEWAYDQLDNEKGVTLDEMTKEAVMKYGAIGW